MIDTKKLRAFGMSNTIFKNNNLKEYLENKEKLRQKMSELPFEEKIEIIEILKETAEFINKIKKNDMD